MLALKPARLALRAIRPSVRTILLGSTSSSSPRLTSPRLDVSAYVLRKRLHQSARACQRSSYAAQAVEDLVSDDVEAQVDAPRPPSSTQIDDATARGPLTQFQQLSDRNLMDSKLVRSLTEGMRLSNMTQVQSMTISETLDGADVLAQAKTGTGKTLAFLMPVLQRMIKDDPSLLKPQHSKRPSPSDIRGLIISPTRELAEQIASEAEKVTAGTAIRVQRAVGGTEKRRALHLMQRQGCHLLVGTPGRLKDILSDPMTGVTTPDLKALVLDEADRLLDDGFWPEIQEIQRLLPERSRIDRQTLMFSATVPPEVMSMVQQTMKKGFKIVRTVQEGEQPTHARVDQKVVNVGGLENLLPTLLELCQKGIERSTATESSMSKAPPFKAIVYFGSTANVTLAASIFRNLCTPGKNVYDRHPLFPARIMEMHARLSQAQRTAASQAFRNAQSAILFSSDVTARGMDFPNVTHVIQVGVPSTRDAYIHRLGRTARAEKTGEGWLLVADIEMREAGHRLREFPIEPDHSLQCARVDMSAPAQLPSPVAQTLTQVTEATKMVPITEKAKAFFTNLSGLAYAPKQKVVDAVNRLSKYGWGLDSPPTVPVGLAQKLGFGAVRDLNTRHGRESFGDDSYRGAESGHRGFGARPDHGRAGFSDRRLNDRGGRQPGRDDRPRGQFDYGRESRNGDRRSYDTRQSRPSYGRDAGRSGPTRFI
ncbi:MAG: hypothetical protein M1833_000392 [Piccolia ochrophora]|nr:MAG: hypothetical protein M1833_000392 [Piccolia ochrophora]